MNFNKFKEGLSKAGDSIKSGVSTAGDSIKSGVSTAQSKWKNVINNNENDDSDQGNSSGTISSGRDTESTTSIAVEPDTIELATESDDVGLIDGVRQEVATWFNLTRAQRYQAFALSFGIGVIMILLGVLAIGFGNLSSFAVLYSLGNILLFGSSFFLSGFVGHLKVMFSEGRATASAVALGSIVLTLFAAFWWKSKILVLLFVFIQVGANLWYSLSYIPYARAWVTKILSRTLDDGQ
ncbi:hypothetical protein SARC_04793 [Sphaeroforma arctica JP610]|uniref:Vesicle transport protein n=1 Tax=Sphaeroforma arctica JP610 TaxID=667725 RepID=A0A0L0G272_9EUKA|nr:hypothetical protein SARC_04793 [Sphaeroforma arctica JP610]KNC82926.1 hypothetical protein SARC_04793 [Sphaeroforma arctica JP610]|eukprot:XP_014156828.1 hypothetical protein SARC_04793 [Sphaeroforma arctica JP610]